jgi:hypothetical protein
VFNQVNQLQRMTRKNGSLQSRPEKSSLKFYRRTNAQNDAILHRLVHTKLLSGSLSADLDMTPAHRRKALAGRVLELTGQAKLGKGEKSVREGERNKAAKRVRDGMLDKQKERQTQQLEEVWPFSIMSNPGQSFHRPKTSGTIILRLKNCSNLQEPPTPPGKTENED